jgi:hypothetical protein
LIDRRTFLRASLALAVAPAVVARAAELEGKLEKSGFVYISPLRSDGSESSCHGEVWYAWLDDSVVIITGSQRWKARALAKGLGRARIWVGDHGTWKKLLGSSQEFRKAPHFDADGKVVKDRTLLDRLLARFEEKYPDEIGEWRDRMRSGFADGSRVLIRYTPSKPLA